MRLLEFREDSGALSMAIDEALMRARAEDRIPDTCRLFRFNPSCVTLGYFQSAREEIYEESRLRQGIDAVRRITGGGAVFHDFSGEITYSVVVSEKNAPRNIQKSYEVLCQPVIAALNSFGLDAEFKPVNDVLVGGKKISGSAQTRRNGVVLQHGTLMYNTNIETLFSVLNISKAKIADKLLKSIKDRVTTISQQTGRDVGMGEVKSAMEKGYAETFGGLEDGKLAEAELAAANKLCSEKYSTESWLYKR